MNYSIYDRGRQDGWQKFGAIHQLPVLRSSYDYIRQSYRGGSMLDVGAGTDLFLQKILNLEENAYFSLDNDIFGTFTYRDVEDIPADQLFTWIILNQLIEHLSIDQAYALLIGLHPHLQERGYLLITTPNVYHPIRYWGDPYHVTPWNYTALYSLCQASGYQVIQIFRYNKNRGPLDPFSWLFERIIRHLYRIDWCDSIMMIATR